MKHYETKEEAVARIRRLADEIEQGVDPGTMMSFDIRFNFADTNGKPKQEAEPILQPWDPEPPPKPFAVGKRVKIHQRAHPNSAHHTGLILSIHHRVKNERMYWTARVQRDGIKMPETYNLNLLQVIE